MSNSPEASNRHPTSERFSDQFTPKFVSAMREGYNLSHLRADALAGLTVAIVALPLSMAIAIASGATPQAGLFAAVIGGLLVSALGGSRFQIGGPAGAFIVLVATTIETHGYAGFLAATMMAGAILLMIGYMRLGTYIKYIPHSVAVGFTASIGVIIFTSQLHELFGLRIAHEPAAFLPKVDTLWNARSTWSPTAAAMAASCLAAIVSMKFFSPRLPGLLLTIVAAASATWAFDIPLETIGSKFGGIPRALPAPAFPDVHMSDLPSLMPSALAIAVLGGIESLLSAVVADGMTGRRHRSNCELAAQGWANIGTALFGGLCVTGAIARTATNIRAGARSPVAGILHAAFLLLFMAVAAPLAVHIPLSALAAILVVVSWNMVERDQIMTILRHDRGEMIVLAVTALLTIFHDITVGIATGVTLGSLIFMHRMAGIVEVETHERIIGDDSPDTQDEEGTLENADPDYVVYRISGPFFFGAAGSVASALDHIGRRPKAFVLDLSRVPLADGAGAYALRDFVERERRRDVLVYVVGASRHVRRTLLVHGLNSKTARFFPDEASAHEHFLNRT